MSSRTAGVAFHILRKFHTEAFGNYSVNYTSPGRFVINHGELELFRYDSISWPAGTKYVLSFAREWLAGYTVF